MKKILITALICFVYIGCGYTKLIKNLNRPPEPINVIKISNDNYPIAVFDDSLDIPYPYIIIGNLCADSYMMLEEEAFNNGLKQAQESGADAIANLSYEIRKEFAFDHGDYHKLSALGSLIKFQQNIYLCDTVDLTFNLPIGPYYHINVSELGGGYHSYIDNGWHIEYRLKIRELPQDIYSVSFEADDRDREKGYTTLWNRTTWIEVRK